MPSWFAWFLLAAWIVAIPFVVPRLTKGFADSSWKRFSLRKLLALMSLVAFLLWAIPASREALQWRATEQFIRYAFEEVKEADRLYQQSARHEQEDFSLANYPYRSQTRTNVPGHVGQKVIVAGGDPITAESEKHRKQGHVYVHPPGEWALNPEEAIQLIRDNL